MIGLLSAIQTAFNGSTALTATFPNGCYLSVAPVAPDGSTELPVCTLTVIGSVPAYYVGPDKTNINTSAIQFSVFSKSDSEALKAIDDIKTVFDFGVLVVSPGAFLQCRRTNEQIIKDNGEADIYHAFVMYSIMVQES